MRWLRWTLLGLLCAASTALAPPTAERADSGRDHAELVRQLQAIADKMQVDGDTEAREDQLVGYLESLAPLLATVDLESTDSETAAALEQAVMEIVSALSKSEL